MVGRIPPFDGPSSSPPSGGNPWPAWMVQLPQCACVSIDASAAGPRSPGRGGKRARLPTPCLVAVLFSSSCPAIVVPSSSRNDRTAVRRLPSARRARFTLACSPPRARLVRVRRSRSRGVLSVIFPGIEDHCSQGMNCSIDATGRRAGLAARPCGPACPAARRTARRVGPFGPPCLRPGLPWRRSLRTGRGRDDPGAGTSGSPRGHCCPAFPGRVEFRRSATPFSPAMQAACHINVG